MHAVTATLQVSPLSQPFNDGDFSNALAFSALLAFSRTLDMPHLGIALYPAAGGPPRFAQWALGDETRLARSMQCMAITETLAPDCHALDVSIRPGEPDRMQSVDTLYYQALPGGEIELALQAGKTFASALSAQDFLEKLALVLAQLRQQPDADLNAVSLRTSAARHLLANPAQVIVPRLYEATPLTFLQVAERHANQPAISDGVRSYDYRALKNAVQFLAAELLAAGLQPGDTVLVSGPSSFGTIAGFVAAMLSGGVLVSLDPSLPEDRQKQIVALSEAKFAIFASATAAAALPRLTPHAFTIAAWPDAAELGRLVTANPPAPVLAPDASAYVFFTSGSTGAPKGVLGQHQGLAHFLDWQRTEFPLGPGDRSAQITALSFDVVLRDILYPLTSGACIHIPERTTVFDARKILAWMRAQRITILHSVPSLMKAWLQSDTSARPFASLKYVFFAGEPLSDDLLTRFQAAASDSVTITNLYGPTETTLAKLYHRLDRVEPGIQPIGITQPGVDVLILRDRKSLCGLDEIGEIAIRTPYRSKGYFKAPELTNEVFIPNPWSQQPGDLIYCTGDLGRVRPDGRVQIFGRIDAQIKIRGVRIEPNEIEAHILKFPGVANVAVTARLGDNQEKTLYAFVELTGTADAAQLNRDMRAFLKARLPEVMIPKRLLLIDQIPHLPNGKVNRKALAALEITEEAGSEGGPDTSTLDADSRLLVEGFEKALGYKLQDLDASFVDHGGDSLSFIQASLSVEKVLGWLPDQWDRLGLRELAALKRDTREKLTGISSVILIRAIAIIFVVLHHFHAIGISGLTSALFVASGWSFGRYQIPAIGKAKSVLPVFKLLFKIVLPVTLYSVFLHTVLRAHYPWQRMLLIDNFIDPNFSGNLSFWFIEDLVQILVIVAALFAIPRVYQIAAKNTTGFAFKAILISLAASFAINQAWNTDYLFNRVPHLSLWLFFIGMAIAGMSSLAHKAIILAMVAGAAALFQLTDSASFALTLFGYGAILFITCIPQVKVPAWLAPAIGKAAGASLFIYMTHFQFSSSMNKVFANTHPLFAGLVAVLGGIVVWEMWEFGYRQIAKRMRWKAKS
jgi:amino acid adenylation domain-containing protein